MKFETKDIIILTLVIVSAFFLLKWLNSSDGELKRKNKELEERVNLLQVTRDSLAKARVHLEEEYKSMTFKLTEDEGKLKELDRSLLDSKRDLAHAKADLEREIGKTDQLSAQIKYLKEHPVNREGEDLIQSLAKKLKK